MNWQEEINISSMKIQTVILNTNKCSLLANIHSRNFDLVMRLCVFSLILPQSSTLRKTPRDAEKKFLALFSGYYYFVFPHEYRRNRVYNRRWIQTDKLLQRIVYIIKLYIMTGDKITRGYARLLAMVWLIYFAIP